jgi:putative ATP-grasp target RiPP
MRDSGSASVSADKGKQELTTTEEGKKEMSVTIEQFAADPLAPVSAQLALNGSTFTERRADQPSPVGARPWGLRRARPATGPGRVLPTWRYDEREQMAVEIASGLPLIVTGDPSADTTETTDGEDGPSSEDWNND